MVTHFSTVEFVGQEVVEEEEDDDDDDDDEINSWAATVDNKKQMQASKNPEKIDAAFWERLRSEKKRSLETNIARAERVEKRSRISKQAEVQKEAAQEALHTQGKKAAAAQKAGTGEKERVCEVIGYPSLSFSLFSSSGGF